MRNKIKKEVKQVDIIVIDDIRAALQRFLEEEAEQNITEAEKQRLMSVVIEWVNNFHISR